METCDEKKVQIITGDDGQVLDYRNVKLKGYLSTFGNIDRDGDIVEPGAFKETIAQFMQKNSVMLRNHRNEIESIAGKFTAMREDKTGLYVEAELSNAPDNISARFKVAEGSLRTLSMGGIFHYSENGRSIFKVTLWEGSLVAIPANPEATIALRAVTDAELKMLKNNFSLAA